jgi:leucyl aminopeptidase (aminopeptidase T)
MNEKKLSEIEKEWLEKTEEQAKLAEEKREIFEKLWEEKEQEIRKLIPGIKNVLDCFQLKRSPDNKKGETLLIVTDTGVDEIVRAALYKAGEEIAGPDFRMVVSRKPERPAEDLFEAIGQKMKSVDAILLATSLSRTHSKETVELFSPHSKEMIRKLQEIRRKIRETEFLGQARVISITSTKPEVFTQGAALENYNEMRERTERLAEVLRKVEKVSISSPTGTNLELFLRSDHILLETGLVNKPGSASNFPFGECGGPVHLKGTKGRLVIDGVSTLIGRIENPITVDIENGKVTKIQGKEEANKLKEILDKVNEEEQKRNPGSKHNAYVVAEFSLGTNRMAYREKNGKKILPSTSLEAEKLEGTFHIAFGKNTILGLSPEDPDYNNIAVHIDNVIAGATVKGYDKEGKEIPLIEKGKLVAIE